MTGEPGAIQDRAGAANGRYRHGMSGTKIYWIWADMVGRATNPNHVRFADYGGRGITVCKQWLTFDAFYADMGDRPHLRSLDRIDNDAGYSPDNCRWATLVEQRANRRPQRRKPDCPKGHPYTPQTLRLTPTGKRRCRKCEAQWARESRARRSAV